jgi:hypothetical protein
VNECRNVTSFGSYFCFYFLRYAEQNASPHARRAERLDLNPYGTCKPAAFEQEIIF